VKKKILYLDSQEGKIILQDRQVLCENILTNRRNEQLGDKKAGLVPVKNPDGLTYHLRKRPGSGKTPGWIIDTCRI